MNKEFFLIVLYLDIPSYGFCSFVLLEERLEIDIVWEPYSGSSLAILVLTKLTNQKSNMRVSFLFVSFFFGQAKKNEKIKSYG